MSHALDGGTLAFPKPERRIRDPKVLRGFLQRNPRCAIETCRSRKGAAPHHLVSRKAGGSDVEDNLLTLCEAHHMPTSPFGWHRIGGHEWFRRFGDALSLEDRGRVMRAMRLEGGEGKPC